MEDKALSVGRQFTDAIGSLAVDSGVIVALSGGADSVCLLHLFVCAKQTGSFDFPLAAAHLNHNLRGEEADRDEQFCVSLCKSFDIPLFTESADVNSFAKREKLGTEEAARKVRYAFFDRLLKENSEFSYIATAHNRGDLCETMLFNLARGSGLSGLCSIPRRRGTIIRPLLSVGKDDILVYDRANGLSFVTDSTNSDTKYNRNRIRHEIMPQMKLISDGAEKNMARTVSLLRKDADYIDGEAKIVYYSLLCDGAINTQKAHNIHFSLLSRALILLYNDSGFTELENVHIEKLCALIASGNENFSLHLPGAVAVCRRGLLRFEKEMLTETAFCEPVVLRKPVTLANGVSLLVTDEENPSGYADFQKIRIRRGATDGSLCVRSRENGDTITVFGKTHKIKRVIADKKLSEVEKNSLFFLCADGEILCAKNIAVSDSAFYRDGEAIYIFYKDKGDASCGKPL